MKKSWQIFWHVFFWLSIISVFLLLAQGEMRLGPEGIFVTFFLYPAINIGLFYLNYLVYIPRFLDKKKIYRLCYHNSYNPYTFWLRKIWHWLII